MIQFSSIILVLFKDILLVSSKFQFYRIGLLLFGFMSDYGILFIEYGLWILNLMEWLWFDYEIPLRMYEGKDEKKNYKQIKRH